MVFHSVDGGGLDLIYHTRLFAMYSNTIATAPCENAPIFPPKCLWVAANPFKSGRCSIETTAQYSRIHCY